MGTGTIVPPGYDELGRQERHLARLQIIAPLIRDAHRGSPDLLTHDELMSIERHIALTEREILRLTPPLLRSAA